MEKTDYLSIDGHQLRILLTIQKAGSLSGAARMLDMNQSTISYWLDLLRKRTGDPLFVRAGNGVEPTERALVLFPEAEAALRHVEAMFEEPIYDPASDVSSLKVSASAVERAALLKPFLNHVRKSAPGLAVEVHPPGSPYQMVENLRRGSIDLGFTVQDAATGDGIFRRKVLSFRDVIYFDPDYPLAENDLDAFCDRPHARVAFGSDASFAVDRRLAKIGRKRNVALQASDFDSVIALVRGTNIVVTLPDILDAPGLSAVDPPWKTEPVNIAMFWHSRNHTSARHSHWRSIIASRRTVDGD